MQPTIQQTFSQYVIQAVPYLFALGLAGLAYLRTHLLIKNKTAQAVFQRLVAAVETAVQAVEQTTVATLKAKSGGTLTEANALVVKNEAIQMAKEHLGGGQWIALAQQILGVADIQKFLADQVEAAVQRLAPSSSPSSVAVATAKK